MQGHLFSLDPTRAYPVLDHADGVYVWDVEGRKYLDAIAGIAVVNVGYGRREVAEAIAAQAKRLPFAVSNIFTSEPAEQLASEIARLTPGDLNWVQFTSGGSEAVEVAIKLSRQYHVERGKPEKSKVIGRWTSYHGATLGALSATGARGRRAKFEPMLLDFPHIPPIYCYRCPLGLTYPACEVACGAELERTIKAIGPQNVAAFIAEPVVGSVGGAITPQPEYFPMIREICDQYDVLLIADEVLTGFGRTGKTFAMEHWEVVPDLMTMGKGISGGYAPLGAVAIRDGIRQVFARKGTPFDHVFTFAANPVSMAAGLAVLDIWERERLLDNVIALEHEFTSTLQELRRYPFVGDVRVIGLMAGVEFVADVETRAPFSSGLSLAKRVRDTGLRHGIVTYPGTGMADGALGDIISLYPPLTFTRDHVREMGQRLHATFEEVGAMLAAEARTA